MTKDHGPTIKSDKVYEDLREAGASKEKAARIANAYAGGTIDHDGTPLEDYIESNGALTFTDTRNSHCHMRRTIESSTRGNNRRPDKAVIRRRTQATSTSAALDQILASRAG